MFLSILNTKLLGLISLVTFLVTVLWCPPKVLVSVAAILELLLFSRASLEGLAWRHLVVQLSCVGRVGIFKSPSCLTSCNCKSIYLM